MEHINHFKKTTGTFCSEHCRGKYYEQDNTKRQARVREAMKGTEFSVLPNLCAGGLSSGCQCEYLD